MKRMKITIRCGVFTVLTMLFLMLVGCGGGGDDTPPAGSIKVANSSSSSIYKIYLSPTSTTNWGPDQLGSNVVSSGKTVTFSVSPGWYDAKLLMSTGNTYVVTNFEVTAGQTFTINNPSYNYKQVTTTEFVNADGKNIETEMDLTIKYVIPEQGQGELKK